MQNACVFIWFVAYFNYADAHGVTRAKTNISEQQAAPGGRAAATKPPRIEVFLFSQDYFIIEANV